MYSNAQSGAAEDEMQMKTILYDRHLLKFVGQTAKELTYGTSVPPSSTQFICQQMAEEANVGDDAERL